MRWKTEKTEDGTERVVRYFALFPKELDDGYTVWLETYYAKEIWYEFETDSSMNHWKTIKTGVQHPNDPGTGTRVFRP